MVGRPIIYRLHRNRSKPKDASIHLEHHQHRPERYLAVPQYTAAQGGYPQYTPPNPAQGIDGRVHINKSQYFEGVPEAVWDFQIGGYQVLHKWLKDRRGRLLTFDDLLHYQKIVGALQETLRLMDEIDAAIPEWPITSD